MGGGNALGVGLNSAGGIVICHSVGQMTRSGVTMCHGKMVGQHVQPGAGSCNVRQMVAQQGRGAG